MAYPQHGEGTWPCGTGRPCRVRPARAEDAPTVRSFYERLPPESTAQGWAILLGHPRYAFPDDAARALGRAADHGSRHAARWRWPGSSWWVRVRNRGTEATGSITTTRVTTTGQFARPPRWRSARWPGRWPARPPLPPSGTRVGLVD